MKSWVRGFSRRGLLVTGFALFSSGCSDEGDGGDGSGGSETGGRAGSSTTGGSGSGSGGTSQGGSGGAAGGNPDAPLFMLAPDCASNVEKLEGTFQGVTVASDRPLGSTTLTGRSYYTVSIGRSRVRLQWGSAIAPNVVQPLTEGGYLLSSWDTANPEVLYCVTAGEIGFLETESSHEYFKYSIARVRSGEVGTTPNSQPATCDGMEMTVDLRGCVQRD